MKPHILSSRVYLLLEQSECFTLATPHLAHFMVEKARNGYAPEDQINDYVVNHDTGSLIDTLS